jgi:hypothetical protein
VVKVENQNHELFRSSLNVAEVRSLTTTAAAAAVPVVVVVGYPPLRLSRFSRNLTMSVAIPAAAVVLPGHQHLLVAVRSLNTTASAAAVLVVVVVEYPTLRLSRFSRNLTMSVVIPAAAVVLPGHQHLVVVPTPLHRTGLPCVYL